MLTTPSPNMPPRTIQLTISQPLTAKKGTLRAGKSKSGKLYTYQPTKVKHSEKAIRQEIADQVKGKNFLPFNYPVIVSVVLNRGKADLIGYLETIFDCLAPLVIVNDRQIEEIDARHSDSTDVASLLIAEIL